jgi:glycosyltransferase involved in cell wall biosynthesis
MTSEFIASNLGLRSSSASFHLEALVSNNQAVLTVINGVSRVPQSGFLSALTLDPDCEPARLNSSLLQAEASFDCRQAVIDPSQVVVPECSPNRPIRVAILGLLFNWPSTGGGIVHTAELSLFLTQAGYDVRHFHARYLPWGIGLVEGSTPHSSEALEFDDVAWNIDEIQARFRRAVDTFAPDLIIITDSWNTKPLLAEAVRGYPYYLRLQAMECLCPLNNLRLLADGPETVRQCPKHQLATPDACRRCLEERGSQSGPLHRVERALAGVGTPEYDRKLRVALTGAEAVLVLNPVTEAMLAPYARCVKVVPWGMDPNRFPSPYSGDRQNPRRDSLVTIFMASVAGEFIKGYHVAHEACRRLRQVRSDFELVVTFDPPGRIDEFTRSVGWQSQEDLPRHYLAADLCIVPTIAQEGLSRTSVEAMASGIPVVASRIGGLPYTVSDGFTGLLFEPGNVDDLVRKLATLLDDPALRLRMGQAGRKRFEDEFQWPSVIERYYRPLLSKRAPTAGVPRS